MTVVVDNELEQLRHELEVVTQERDKLRKRLDTFEEIERDAAEAVRDFMFDEQGACSNKETWINCEGNSPEFVSFNVGGVRYTAHATKTFYVLDGV